MLVHGRRSPKKKPNVPEPQPRAVRQLPVRRWEPARVPPAISTLEHAEISFTAPLRFRSFPGSFDAEINFCSDLKSPGGSGLSPS